MKTQKLTLFNSLSKKKEVLEPINPPKIGMYVCGPTVYGPGHLGHARTYVSFDIIRKWLEHSGFKVKFIINITDVHDKVKEDTDIDKYTKEFIKDLKTLNVKKVDSYTRVSEHIEEIKEMVDELLEKGYAYKVGDDIYYDTSKFKGYGKLSRRKLEEAKTGTRVDTDEYEREEAADFALWKGDRPGWHIECSAMSRKYLGDQFDIHGGGIDLIFPHHENEIAQSEAVTGKKPFVKYWMHAGMLDVDGKKMGKSLGNYIEIPDLLKKYEVRVFRMFVLSHHYRKPADFTEEAMEEARKALERLDSFPDGNVDIKEEMNDDFNTQGAMAKIFKAKKWTPEIESVFGITKKVKKEIPESVKKLLDERGKARDDKDWNKSDSLRKEIETLGFKVKDTDEGQKIV